MLEFVNEENLEKETKRTATKALKKVPLVEITELPSQFKCYPEGTKIFYEPIRLEELEALNSGTIDVERGMQFLLDAIHCEQVAPEDLAYFDIIYIGIMRKLHAFGDVKAVISKYCPTCGNLVKHEFSYTEIDFIEIAEDVKFPAITTIGGVEVEFGLITYRDFMSITSEDGTLGVYARMIKNLPYETALELIKNAVGEEIQIIKTIEQVFNYGIKPFKELCLNEHSEINDDGTYNTTVCETEVLLEVKSPFEVVFPYDRPVNSYKAKIQFGRS